jgi:hypothetical protein
MRRAGRLLRQLCFGQGNRDYWRWQLPLQAYFW